MNKLEMYFDKERDCIQVVVNGEIKYCDEAVHSSDYMCVNGNYLKNIYEYNDYLPEEILAENEAQAETHIYICGEKEHEEYLEFVKSQTIKGELFYSKEFK